RRVPVRLGGEERIARPRADHARLRGLREHAHRLPGRLQLRPAHAPGQPRGVRLGAGRAISRLSAVQGLQALACGLSPSIADRLGALDWTAIGASLDELGFARTPPLLTPE